MDDAEAAKYPLSTAVRGLDLTDGEKRTMSWLLRWDMETVRNVASVIEKARSASLHD